MKLRRKLTEAPTEPEKAPDDPELWAAQQGAEEPPPPDHWSAILVYIGMLLYLATMFYTMVFR